MIEDSQDPIEIKNPEPKNQQNKISNIEIKNKNCSIKIDNYKLERINQISIINENKNNPNYLTKEEIIKERRKKFYFTREDWGRKNFIIEYYLQ
jgi:hypothetical protein